MTGIIKIATVLLFAGILALLNVNTIARDANPAAKKGEMLEAVVAVVNGSPLTRTRVMDKIRRDFYLRGLIPPADPSSELIREFLNQLIDEEIFVQKAKMRQIAPSAEIIDNFTERFVAHARRIFPDEKTFLQHVDLIYIDLADFKIRCRQMEEREYLANGVVSMNITITDKELRDFEKKLKKEGALPQKYRLRHILLTYPLDSDAETEDAVLERAFDLLIRIQGGADFDEMAKRYSKDSATSENGGDLGQVTEGEMNPEIEKAVKRLKEGEVSLPIKTENGIHLIKLEEKANVRSLLFRERFYEEKKKLHKKLKEKASIKILGKNI